MVKQFFINKIEKEGKYRTDEIIIGKILKIYVNMGDCPRAHVKVLTTEDEVVMDRDFMDGSDVYKPLDVIVEGTSYQHFYSMGQLKLEITGSVSEERPIEQIRIYYE